VEKQTAVRLATAIDQSPDWISIGMQEYAYNRWGIAIRRKYAVGGAETIVLTAATQWDRKKRAPKASTGQNR
jgi:hypothetical protein